MGSPHFKIATEDWEFEQIHRLNYETFVEEIPEHVASASRRLVDRFHDENTYAIGLDNRRLVGMLAIRGRRPFSLDLKLLHRLIEQAQLFIEAAHACSNRIGEQAAASD